MMSSFRAVVAFSVVLSVLTAAPALGGEAEAYPDDTVVLEHGKTRVTLGEVRRSIEQTVPPEQQVRFYGEKKNVTQHAGNFFVVRKLAEEAAARQLSESERFRVEEARIRALSQVQLDHIVAQEQQPDYEAVAREEWKAHPEKYQGAEAVHVSHILVKAGDARGDTEALARAQEALAKLKAGGDFSALAKEYSDDPSVGQNNGDLGFFQRGQMVKPFEDAAFAMQKPGELTGPVKTDFGYHVLRFESRRPAGLLPFDSVKDRLIANYEAEFRARIVNREIERLGTLAGVKTNYDALVSLHKPIEYKGAKPAGEPAR